VTDAVKRLAWDDSKKLFADTPGKRTFSQHVNAFAVLADLVPPRDQREFMLRVLRDPTLTQATYYFRFYLVRAMNKAGLGDGYLAELGPWREMLDLGLTTWAEKPEPTRSDSHAWSAHPNFFLLTMVAGVEPATPGFSTVKIAPHLGSLMSLKATVPTPKGLVQVGYTKKGESLTAEIVLPPTVSGTFEWNGRTTPLRPGRQTVTY
jgi:hypothetical protein